MVDTSRVEFNSPTVGADLCSKYKDVNDDVMPIE